MALDPNIPLSMPKQPSFAEQMGQAYDLAGAFEKRRVAQEERQMLEAQRQDQQILQEALKTGSDISTSRGLEDTIKQLTGKVTVPTLQKMIQAKGEIRNKEMEYESALTQMAPEILKMQMEQQNVIGQTLDQTMQYADQVTKQFGEVAAAPMIEAFKQQQADRVRGIKLPNGRQIVDDSLIQQYLPMNLAQMATAAKNNAWIQDKTKKAADAREAEAKAITAEAKAKVAPEMAEAELKHEQRLGKGVGLAGTGGTSGLPAKGWKFVQSSEGIYRANPNAGVVQKQDEETGEWSQVLENEMPDEVIEKLGGQKSVSAITDRLNRRTITAAGEVARGLNMVAMMPVGQSEGLFNYDKPSGITTALKRQMTPQEAIDYNSATSAMALELTTLLRGGMQLNEAEIKEVKDGLMVYPGMNIANARYRFANTVSKTLTALENFEPTSAQQTEQKEKYIKELSKYPSPEQVYEENQTGKIKKQTMAESLAKTKEKMQPKLSDIKGANPEIAEMIRKARAAGAK